MSAREPRPSGKYVKYAWLSLLGYVLSFALTFTVGESLATMFGYPPGGAEPAPGWVIAASIIPALLVFAIPGIVAAYFGRKATRAGDRRGNVPAWLGLGIAAGFAAMNAAVLIIPAL